MEGALGEAVPSSSGSDSPPTAVLRLPPGSIVVADADDETFDLYTTLTLCPASTAVIAGHSSLGMVDPSLARLSLSLNIASPARGMPNKLSTAASSSRSGRKVRAAGGKAKAAESVELTLELGQDMRRLKGSGGDTASVVWRTSLHLLAHVLPHLMHPSAPCAAPALLALDDLRQSTVLELGSGTGALASVLSPFAKRWIASDLPEALRLIEANLKLNGIDPSSPAATVEIQEIDWTTYLPGHPDRPRPPADPATLPDLIIATDVLYHPSLIQPLLATLNFYSHPSRTVTLFVAEFRTEDVVRDWIQAWLHDDGVDRPTPELPKDVDDYVHRIGRTGRAGNTGTATAFFNRGNKGIARELIELLREANQEIPDWLSDVSHESSFGGGGYRGFGGGRGGGGRSGGSGGRTATKDVRSGGYGAPPPRMSQGAGFGGAPIGGARPAPAAGGWW